LWHLYKLGLLWLAGNDRIRILFLELLWFNRNFSYLSILWLGIDFLDNF
jgi:hypothetical protein